MRGIVSVPPNSSVSREKSSHWNAKPPGKLTNRPVLSLSLSSIIFTPSLSLSPVIFYLLIIQQGCNHHHLQ